jgi:hypothetical protein
VNRKGDRREAASERSGERSRGPTYRNRIEAGVVGTSGHVTAKSRSIKGHERKSGGRAVKKIELTSGDLRRAAGPCANTRSARLSGPQGPMTAPEKSAEGVVIRHVTGNGRAPRPASTDEGPNGKSGK